MSLSSADQWCQQGDLPLIEPREDILNNFFLAPFHHLFSRIIGIGMPYPCKQQTEKIINLRNGTHGRTGVLIGGLLFYGDYRGEACDLVYIRPFHIPNELP